jgi:hypothetical protein
MVFVLMVDMIVGLSIVVNTVAAVVSSPSSNAETVLRTYVRAKDENRPHLLAGVFTPDATLEVRNKSSAIAFPAVTAGRDAIADVLVRNFAKSYENVYTFYMARPDAEAADVACDWLVCMTEKDSGSVRVGCGRYDWTLQAHPHGLATRLVIGIEAMQILAPDQFEPVFAWVRSMDYPWTSANAAVRDVPQLPALAPVLDYLAREGSG